MTLIAVSNPTAVDLRGLVRMLVDADLERLHAAAADSGTTHTR